jgi:hypothetical protein
MNKEIAYKRLKATLLAIAQEQRVKEIKAIRGDIVEAVWMLSLSLEKRL